MVKDIYRRYFPDGTKKLTWLSGILLAAVIAALCSADLFPALSGKREVYPVVVLGDSIIGSDFGGEGVCAYLEEDLGVPVFRGGFGGTCASYVEQDVMPHTVSAQLSLSKLAEAVAAGDFSVQKAQVAYGTYYLNILGETLDYFKGRLTDLSRIDFERTKYLVIEHGTNDYNSGRLLDNENDPYDKSSFGGGIRCAIETLREAYPDMEVILMTPTWCYIIQDEEMLSCTDTDYGGGYLEDYVNLELEIAREYDIPVLDNFHESGIGPETQDLYLRDGLHLNAAGQKIIADMLAQLIRETENKQ